MDDDVLLLGCCSRFYAMMLAIINNCLRAGGCFESFFVCIPLNVHFHANRSVLIKRGFVRRKFDSRVPQEEAILGGMSNSAPNGQLSPPTLEKLAAATLEKLAAANFLATSVEAIYVNL